jgi:hypothetical protein
LLCREYIEDQYTERGSGFHHGGSVHDIHHGGMHGIHHGHHHHHHDTTHFFHSIILVRHGMTYPQVGTTLFFPGVQPAMPVNAGIISVVASSEGGEIVPGTVIGVGPPLT